MTKNLKILYTNLDSLLMISEADQEQKCAPMTVYEKIYGQQSFLLCSKLIIVDGKVAKFLQCLNDFKTKFITDSLNAVFAKDLILQTLLGHRGGKRQKILPRELASDVEIHCTLSYGLNEPPFTQRLLSILITVDADNVMRVYLQYPDQSELLFKYQVKFEHADDFAASVEFYLRAKCIIVTSKFGQNIVVTAQSKQFNIFGPSFEGMRVSRVMLFDYKSTEYLAIGLSSGNCIIKLAD